MYNKSELEVKIRQEELFAAYDIAQEILASENDLDILYKLGVICTRIGKISEAQKYLSEYLSQGGNEPFARLNLAHMLKAQGNFAEAANEYKKFISNNDKFAGHGWWHLADLKDFSPEQSDIDLLEVKKSSLTANSPDRMLINFALGTYYERLHDSEKAFAAFKEANDTHCKIKPFNRDGFRKLIANLEKLTKIQTFNFEPAAVPIFIVGMPRSGSTLYEQILSSHSQIIATDELPFINAFAAGMERTGSYASALLDLTYEAAQKLRQEYLDKTAYYRPEPALHFIDKSPINFIHIGLIKTLFPEAIIVNTYRDAFDNATSIYKRYFYMGNEYAYSLDGIAEYMSGYVRLMNLWNRLLPNQIIHCQYEDLVNDPDNKIREIIAACGFPFEKNCLRYFQTKRTVLTPSVDQVSKPIYKSSMNSWRQYETWFSELEKLKFLLVNKQYEIYFGSSEPTDETETWSDYWSSGYKTSFFGATNYEGEIKAYWQNLVEAIDKPARVLDLCTGNGALASLLAEAVVGQDVEIVGVDSATINPESAEVALADSSIQLIGNTRVEKLPFENEYFDLVVSQFGFEYTDLELCVAEVGRVLKPSGLFHAVCHSSDSGIFAENSRIHECSGLILQNCIPLFGEMLKGLDFEALGESDYKSVSEYCRERFNNEIGILHNSFGDTLFATGFPASMKHLLSLKNTGTAFVKFSEYVHSLRRAQERLEQLFNAALSEEKLKRLFLICERNELEILRAEELKQNNFVIGKIIEAKKGL